MKLERTNRVIDNFNEKLGSKAKKKLTNSRASGNLYTTFKLSKSDDEDIPNIEVTMEDYGDFVDEGRKPGKGVPVEGLRKWVKQKGLVLQNSNGDSLKMTDSRINSLAYVINRKIKREGIKPTNFLTAPLDELITIFSNDVADAYGDDLIDELFTDLE